VFQVVLSDKQKKGTRLLSAGFISWVVPVKQKPEQAGSFSIPALSKSSKMKGWERAEHF